MNRDDRTVILDTARYLRSVRPIDPSELVEYTSDATVEAVRSLLRDLAVDLELIERADGTFVPVSPGPAAIQFEGVERLPDRFENRLEQLVIDYFGPEWPHDEQGDELRTTIRDMKARYLAGKRVEYDYPVALGYALYHVANYFAGIQYVLHELGDRQLLDRSLRILDVGAGVGGPAIGISEYLPDDILVDYTAIEPSEAARILETLLTETGRNFHWTVERTTAEEYDPEEAYDLILFANVLSELDRPTDLVRRYLSALEPTGSLVTVAPADRNTSIGLRQVERNIGDRTEQWSIYAPTVRLWPGERPTDTGWSFATYPAVTPPRLQQRLDSGRRAVDAEEVERPAGSGEFVNSTVQLSYSILRGDGQTRVQFRPDSRRFAKFATLERHISSRIDCVGVKLSDDLGTGTNQIFRVGDGSQSVDTFAVLAKETAFNQPLRTTQYGRGLQFEQVLVLWNEDEGGINLVVDGDTVVEPVP